MPRFPDNSRICFVGDSITHINKYLMHIVSFYKKNFPDSNIDFYNCGVAGANLNELLKILEDDTLSYKPTHIVMMIGINDSARDNLLECRSIERYEKLKTAFQNYKENLFKICDSFKSNGIEVTLCTCVPYDEYGEYCTSPLKGGMSLIMSYNEYIRNFAREKEIALCDYFPYMIEKMQTKCIYEEDGVHPNDLGHYYMAKCFLEYQGLEFKKEQFSKKIIEWNDFVLKMRDIWACEFILLGNHFLTYDEGIEKLKPYLNEKNDGYDYLFELAKKYQFNKPYQSYIKKRIIEIMEEEL